MRDPVIRESGAGAPVSVCVGFEGKCEATEPLRLVCPAKANGAAGIPHARRLAPEAIYRALYGVMFL
jgi:hypothetical protein